MMAHSNKARILTVIGTRPQSIKTAAVSHLLQEQHGDAMEERILYTGQHYDRNLFRIFFEELNIPEPYADLEVGSGGQGEQTADMLKGTEKVFLEASPDLVLLYGDTNSTLAGALAASKLHIPVAHVEAGLRSYRKGMAEEINRLLTDHVSSLLFAPTRTALTNLEKEGFELEGNEAHDIDHPAVHLSGDVMYDNAIRFASIAERRSDILERMKLESGFVLVTVHRAENTKDPERLKGILEGIRRLLEKSGKKAILPLHPGTRKALEELPDAKWKRFAEEGSVRICDPLPYLDMVRLQRNASLIVTDSGGLQKEAFFHGKPCLVLRDETEWKELVENGNSVLVGADPARIEKGLELFESKTEEQQRDLFGSGKAGSYICDAIRGYLGL